MNPELEKDSAPPFEKYLDDNNIKHLICDLDNTLLSTDEHFQNILYNLGIDISTLSPLDPHYFLADEMSRQLKAASRQRYYSNDRKPELMDERYLIILKQYLEDIGGGSVTEEMKQSITHHAHYCYNTCPKVFQGVKEFLEVIQKTGRTISYHSHAQESWTKIKVEHLDSLLDTTPSPYLSTPIGNKKDKEAWYRSFLQSGYSSEEILVAGDNFYADILPSIQAGCKNLVWIAPDDHYLPSDFSLPLAVKIVKTASINDLLNGNYTVL